jgi:hypothetical protein
MSWSTPTTPAPPTPPRGVDVGGLDNVGVGGRDSVGGLGKTVVYTPLVDGLLSRRGLPLVLQEYVCL